MGLFSAKGIKEISSDEFKRKIKLTHEEAGQDGEAVEVSEEYEGVKLKEELAGFVNKKGRRLSAGEMEKELKNEGVEGSQYEQGKKTLKTLKDHFDKDA